MSYQLKVKTNCSLIFLRVWIVQKNLKKPVFSVVHFNFKPYCQETKTPQPFVQIYVYFSVLHIQDCFTD